MTEPNTGCARNQGTTQFCAEAVEAHRELREARADIERLKTRVGWLDHLDTPEGRAMHATEAVKVENEELRAEVERLRNHINSSQTAFCVELGALRLSLKQVDAAADALRADLREAMELLRAHGQAPNGQAPNGQAPSWLHLNISTGSLAQ